MSDEGAILILFALLVAAFAAWCVWKALKLPPRNRRTGLPPPSPLCKRSDWRRQAL
jgi:hypothetical protein